MTKSRNFKVDNSKLPVINGSIKQLKGYQNVLRKVFVPDGVDQNVVVQKNKFILALPSSACAELVVQAEYLWFVSNLRSKERQGSVSSFGSVDITADRLQQLHELYSLLSGDSIRLLSKILNPAIVIGKISYGAQSWGVDVTFSVKAMPEISLSTPLISVSVRVCEKGIYHLGLRFCHDTTE
jgi:hypothetical protein